MTSRIPLFSTIVVLAAAAVMVVLGIWQLGRADEKEAMLASFGEASRMSSAVEFPSEPAAVPGSLYRFSQVVCDTVLSQRTTAARSEAGRSGIGQMATCALANGGEAEIALGWTARPDVIAWNGGAVSGFIAPAGEGARLVAMPPVAGLEQLARPDPNDLPNNHLAYAGQWFLFALTALVIYGLVLRSRFKPTRRE